MDDVLTPPFNYGEAIRRRLPLGFIVALGLLVASIVLALTLPAIYESRAVVLIEQQDIPEDLVRSLNTSFADQRIQVISQRVLTTANLREIIEKFNLYSDERASDPLEVVVEEMRDDIAVRPVSADIVDQRSGRPTKATIAVELAFENPDPLTAQRVTNDIVSLFLSENLKQRTEAAEDTLDFLTEEAKRLDNAVRESEQRLADFKEEHVDALPELASLNLQLLTRAEQDLVQVENQIRSLEQQRVYLESELSQQEPTVGIITSQSGERLLGPADRLKALEAEFITLNAKYGPQHPDVLRMKREIESLRRTTGQGNPATELEARLRNLEAELATKSERYGDDHPDIRSIEREIQAVRQQLASASASPEPEPTYTNAEVPDNPVYVQLRARLDATSNDIASYRSQAASLRAKIDDYERRLTAAPQVEREYTSLVRDYEIAAAEYKEVQAKRQQAVVARSLEEGQKGERFTLIEPPLVPEEPASPNRLAIALVGLFLSIVGGVGAGAVAEAIDDRIHGRSGVAEMTGVPPLAVIPALANPAARVATMRRRIIYMLFAVLLVAAAMLTVHFFFSPLDVLYFRAMRALG
ncbi:MAG: lipopolysaccharide biosynthesis protein [Gammaproteobacteria bacterium]